MIISTGFVPIIGDDIRWKTSFDSEVLRNDKISQYKDVEKTRTRTSGTGRYMRTYTEKYYEKQYNGTETKTVTKNYYIFKYADSKQKALNDSLKVVYYLPHHYFDIAKQKYAIEYNEMDRGEIWLYALPEKIYCASCASY